MEQRYNYGKTMMLKMGIGTPDNKGGCRLSNTFPEILEKIKTIDRITCGAPKIVYLVGWQYLGHDDRYPAFFEVNEYAKRDGMTARESLLWLIGEAKEYHTAVSLHINLSDAYKESPLWREYRDNDLIMRGKNGKPKPIGTWNGRTAYQVRFQKELESGYFMKRVDRLFELVPLSEIGTVHVDAFFVRKGKDNFIESEKAARREMIRCFNERGCDVTSEFVYNERQRRPGSLGGLGDTVGLIPAVWHLKLTQRECLQTRGTLFGGTFNKNLQRDKKLKYLFYENMHGEGVCDGDGWRKSFLHDFAVQTVPYFYLNGRRCEGVSGHFNGRAAHFEGNVEARIKGKEIRENGELIKREETLMLPLYWLPDTYFAYSKTKNTMRFPFSYAQARVQKITENGLSDESVLKTDGGITLSFGGDAAYLIRGEKQEKNR